MSQIASFSSVRDDLAEIISPGTAGLVLGAGASESSGGMLWGPLVKELCDRFPKAPVSPSQHPFEICDLICETPVYGRAPLVEFVKERLGSLVPSQDYAQIPRVKWQAIFTTNYDDLLEQAYRSTSRRQNLDTVHLLPDALVLAARPKHVLGCCLMGSVRNRFDSSASPVLTWSDFYSTQSDREKMLALVETILLQGGKIIYVGYSFDDFILLRVVEAVVSKIGLQAAPYGYALMGSGDGPTGTHLHRLQARKVVPIRGSFEDLAALLRDIADGSLEPRHGDAPKLESPGGGRALFIHNEEIRLDDEVASVFDESFQVLSEEEIIDPRGSESESTDESSLAKSFLEGMTLGWLPYVKGWTYCRPAYHEIYGNVRTTAELGDPAANEVILIHGPAGLGKSVMVRQLAFDLYRKAQIPVLLARASWISRPDIRLLDRYLNEIELARTSNGNLPALVVIVDQAELLEHNLPYRAAKYLRGKGRSVLFVLTARTNEYFRDNTGEKNLGDPREFEIPEKLEEGEVAGLIAHIQKLGVWDRPMVTTEAFWKEYVAKEFDNTFFDTVYSLVEPTREPLRKRVWSEFENLSALAQRAYIYIAALHQFSIPLKMEVLRRALDVPFTDFLQDIIKSDARAVLFSESQGADLNLYFRGRSRMISELVFSRALVDPQEQLDTFKEIVRATEPSEMFGNDELDALRHLLVHVLGPSGYDHRFSVEETAELFREAVEQVEDDVLEHHCGLAEREAGRLLSAKQHLEKSLAMSALIPVDYTVQREAPQNIENSLAVVCGLLALEALKRKSLPESDGLYEDAKRHFVNARAGQFPNAAAYDAHARVLRDRAAIRFAQGSPDQALALGEALAIVDDGIDSVNEDYRKGLVELRSRILYQLGDFQEAIADLAARAEKGNLRNRALYHIILGRLLMDLPNVKGKHFKKALSHATSACELDPTLFQAWKLRAKCYARLQPKDRVTQFEYLEQCLVLPGGREDTWVLYNSAVIAFDLEKFTGSFEHFRQLRKIAKGDERQFGMIEYAGVRGGLADPLEFTGRVVRTGPARLGIECEELSVFSPVWFNPKIQRFYTARQGHNVKFLVGFNYRGLSGEDVEQT